MDGHKWTTMENTYFQCFLKYEYEQSHFDAVRRRIRKLQLSPAILTLKIHAVGLGRTESNF